MLLVGAPSFCVFIRFYSHREGEGAAISRLLVRNGWVLGCASKKSWNGVDEGESDAICGRETVVGMASLTRRDLDVSRYLQAIWPANSCSRVGKVFLAV